MFPQLLVVIEVNQSLEESRVGLLYGFVCVPNKLGCLLLVFLSLKLFGGLPRLLLVIGVEVCGIP
jgi:hypothetical protein